MQQHLAFTSHREGIMTHAIAVHRLSGPGCIHAWPRLPLRGHKAPTPEPVDDPLPGEHPVPQEEPVPSPNPESRKTAS